MGSRIPVPLTDHISGESTVQAEFPPSQQPSFIDDHPTERIVPPKDGFRALPEGALLGHETYYVTSIRSEDRNCNVYGIEETRPIFPCPNLKCGHLDNPFPHSPGR